MPTHRYLALYKPFGVLSQFTDHSPSPRPALKQFVPVPDVYPVGRLDFDSEGLLLLTSDGAFQHRLAEPAFSHPRTYWAQVEGAPASADLEPLRRGVVIQGQRTRPAAVRILTQEPDLAPRNPPVRYRRQIPTTWVELILTEGRNRQVRRMTAAVGYPTLRLVRVAIGGLRLEGLAPGQWRELTPAEVRAALASTNLKQPQRRLAKNPSP